MATEKTQSQNQEGNAGGGQGGEAGNFEAKLAEFQANLKAEQEKVKVAEQKAETAERARAKAQSQLDQKKAAELMPKRQPLQQQQQQLTPAQLLAQRAAGQLPPAVSPAQQRLQEIDETAAQAGKEALLYRELLRRGLTEEDVEGLEFETPSELKVALDQLQSQKEIAKLRAELDAAKVTKETTTTTTTVTKDDSVDTGGLSGGQGAGSDDTSKRIAELRELAKKEGRTEKGRWALLQAIHLDESKVIRKTPSIKEE